MYIYKQKKMYKYVVNSMKSIVSISYPMICSTNVTYSIHISVVEELLRIFCEK